MRKSLRRKLLLGLMLWGGMSFVITACTRERATETPAPTLTLPAEPVNASGSGSGAGSEPAVEQATPTAESATPEATATETETPIADTFEYPVAAGDTLFSIATKFETDVDTIRRLNFLIDDNIIVGQIIQVPYKEGMTAAGAPTATPEPFRYTVAQGDTLSSIAQQFGVSTVAIIEANNILDPNNLVVGQAILIPGYVATTDGTATGGSTAGGATPGATPNTGTATVSGVTHVVQPGEGLLEIAEKYGVDVNELAQANNITNRNVLRAGQTLIIPGVTEQQAARVRGTVHVVQTGESLSSIARSFGVSVDEILKINEIDDPNSIYVGQELIIPAQQ